MNQNDTEQIADEIAQIEGKTEKEGSRKNFFTTVTPFSKYLAFVLFVVLPFIGGWVGYSFTPVEVVEIEKVVEVEKHVEVEKYVVENATSNRYSEPQILHGLREPQNIIYDEIYTQKIKEQGDSIRGYILTNKFYSLYFEPEGGTIDERFDNREGTFRNQVSTIWMKDNSGVFFRIIAGNNKMRIFDMEKKVITTLNIEGEIWEYLGDDKYCDVGECDTKENIYRKEVGDYIVYVITLEPLHGAEFVLSEDGETRVYTTLSELKIIEADQSTAGNNRKAKVERMVASLLLTPK